MDRTPDGLRSRAPSRFSSANPMFGRSVPQQRRPSHRHRGSGSVYQRGSVAATTALRHRRSTAYQHVVAGDADAHEGRLSCCMYLTYAMPSMGTVPVVMLISVYGVTFYEKLNANLAYIAFFIALARSFDVVTDPVMSFITDSHRGKHGRRRPFILTGCVPYGLFLCLLLVPPAGLGETAVSCWFGLTYILFFLCNTYTNIPYDALGPELTDNYDDRSRVFFTCTLFDGFGTLLAVMTPVALAMYLGGDCDYSSCQTPHDGSGAGLGPGLSLAWTALSSSAPSASASASASASSPPAAALANASASVPRISTMSCTAHPLGGSYAAFPLDGLAQSAHPYTVGTPLNFTGADCLAASAPSSGVGGLAACQSLPAHLTAFCACRGACGDACNIDSERSAYMLVAVAFSVWFVASQANLVWRVKERAQSAAAKPQPLVPLLLNIMQNQLFTALLPAWVCDAIVNAVIGSMLTYFVRYVVVPEYQPGCCAGASESWKCSSTMVLAASATAVLFAAFLGSPLWLMATSRFGKRRAWLLWSLTMAFTNGLYMLVGEGDVWPCIIISGMNGLPMGAKFLSDTILADVIDYDEWLRGSRNEATYMMFKSFLPKIAAIPASAIPVALLNAFGHVAPEGGRIMRQEGTTVAWYIRVVIVIIPSALSFLAFALKTRFPLKTKEQTDDISTGIGQHMLGLPAIDPLSGMEYSLLSLTDKERTVANLLDNFPGVDPLDRLLSDPAAGAIAIRRDMRRQLIYSCVAVVTSLVAVLTSFRLISSKNLSFLPVLFIIVFGASITATGFCYLRLGAANKLVALATNTGNGNPRRVNSQHFPLNESLLERLMDNRRLIADSARQLSSSDGMGGATDVSVVTGTVIPDMLRPERVRRRAQSVWHHIQTYEPSQGSHCSCLRISFHSVNLAVFLVGLIFILRAFDTILGDGMWPSYLGVSSTISLWLGVGGVTGIIVVLAAAILVHLMGHTDEELRRRCITQLGIVFYFVSVVAASALQMVGCFASNDPLEWDTSLRRGQSLAANATSTGESLPATPTSTPTSTPASTSAATAAAAAAAAVASATGEFVPHDGGLFIDQGRLSTAAKKAHQFINCTFDYCCLRLNNYVDYGSFPIVSDQGS
jgi:Na+/melibiose symporter-like transporter